MSRASMAAASGARSASRYTAKLPPGRVSKSPPPPSSGTGDNSAEVAMPVVSAGATTAWAT